MTDVNNILKKSKWSGKEVGKLLIASLANDVMYSMQKEKKPLVKQEDFDKMVKSLLPYENQYYDYLVYERIYNSCMSSYNRVQSLAQQFLHGYYRLSNALLEVKQADKTKAIIEDYPLVLTQTQFDRLKKQAQYEKDSLKINVSDLLEELLLHYIFHIEDAPAAVKESIEELKEVPATTKPLINEYIELKQDYHYVLKDGTDSSKCSKKDWQEAIKKAWISNYNIDDEEIKEKGFNVVLEDFFNNEILKFEQACFEGKEALIQLGKSSNTFLRQLACIEDAPEEEIEDIIDYIYYECEKIRTREGAAYFNLEEILDKSFCDKVIDPYDGIVSKYDLIYCVSTLNYYFRHSDSEEVLQKNFNLFKKDYPQLCKVLSDDLQKRLKLKRFPALNKEYSRKKIATLGFPFFKTHFKARIIDIVDQYSRTLSEEEDYQKKKRASYKGLALINLEDQFLNRSVIDYYGNYIEPKNPYYEMFSLDSITEEDAKIIQSHITYLIAPALKYILSHNALIKILSELYDVPALMIGQIDIYPINKKCIEYNKALFNFFETLSGSDTEVKRKRKLLCNYFKPIYTKDYEPLEETKVAIREELKSLTNKEAALKLQTFNNYIHILVGD